MKNIILNLKNIKENIDDMKECQFYNIQQHKKIREIGYLINEEEGNIFKTYSLLEEILSRASVILIILIRYIDTFGVDNYSKTKKLANISLDDFIKDIYYAMNNNETTDDCIKKYI